jgi:hypothetical protein
VYGYELSRALAGQVPSPTDISCANARLGTRNSPVDQVNRRRHATSDGATPNCAAHSHRQRPGYDTLYPSLRCERFKEAPPDDACHPAIRHHRFPVVVCFIQGQRAAKFNLLNDRMLSPRRVGGCGAPVICVLSWSCGHGIYLACRIRYVQMQPVSPTIEPNEERTSALPAPYPRAYPTLQHSSTMSSHGDINR